VLTALFERQRQLEAELSALQRSRIPRVNAGGQLDYSSSTLFTPQAIGPASSGSIGISAPTRAARSASRPRGWRSTRTASSSRPSCGRSNRRCAAPSAPPPSADGARHRQVAVGQAEENLRIRQQQFGVGRAQTRDVLDAQRLLAEQRAVLATALYEAQTRRAEMQQLMGEPFEALLAEKR
jgi:outer membrane protein TolC